MCGVWHLYTDTLIKMVFFIWILSQVQINLSGSEAGHPFTSQLHTKLISARLNNMGIKQSGMKDKKQDQEHA